MLLSRILGTFSEFCLLLFPFPAKQLLVVFFFFFPWLLFNIVLKNLALGTQATFYSIGLNNITTFVKTDLNLAASHDLLLNCFPKMGLPMHS